METQDESTCWVSCTILKEGGWTNTLPALFLLWWKLKYRNRGTDVFPLLTLHSRHPFADNFGLEFNSLKTIQQIYESLHQKCFEKYALLCDRRSGQSPWRKWTWWGQCRWFTSQVGGHQNNQRLSHIALPSSCHILVEPGVKMQVVNHRKSSRHNNIVPLSTSPTYFRKWGSVWGQVFPDRKSSWTLTWHTF